MTISRGEKMKFKIKLFSGNDIHFHLLLFLICIIGTTSVLVPMSIGYKQMLHCGTE